MTTTALLIGTPETLRRLQAQLALVEDGPVVLGWVLAHAGDGERTGEHDGPVLGKLEALEAIIARRRPALALVSLPAVMRDLIQATRTRLRKLGVPDRFMPTLEDQLAGVGPRTHIDVDLAGLTGRPARTIDERRVRSIIAGKRVLITGAGGSIGSEMARLTAEFNPAQLVLVDRTENALFEIDRQIARRHPDLQRHALLHDVVDRAATHAHFKRLKPQIVFHAAAHKHVPMMEEHPGAAVDNNLFGTQSAAVAADAVGAERFVMISTDKAVRPTSIMGATKRLAELYVHECSRHSRTCFAIVRFGNVLGSTGSVLDIWSRQIAEGGPVTITDPRMTRYFMTIHEAALLVMQAAAMSGDAPQAEVPGADVFVLDMGEPIPIIQLVQRYIEQHGLTPRLVPTLKAGALVAGAGAANSPGAIDVVVTGQRPGEKLHEELVSEGEATRPTDHPQISVWMRPPSDGRYIERILHALDPVHRPQSPAALGEAIRRHLAVEPQPAAA